MITKTLACRCPTSSQLSRNAGGFGLRCGVHLPGCRIGAHSHPEARIVLPLRFGFDTRFGRRTIAVNASAAVFRPAGEEHEDSYRVPTTSLSLLLPMDGPAASSREPFAVRDGAFPSVAQAFRSEMAAADTASPLVMEGLALLTTSRVLQHRPLQLKGTPRWIGSVRERLEAEYSRPPSLADLGRMVQRDAAHVAATFKRIYGRSAGAYVRDLRLWEARRSLQTEPECALCEVAQRCGFADQSHFNRQFKRLFALTPLEYRQRHRAHPVPVLADVRRGRPTRSRAAR